MKFLEHNWWKTSINDLGISDRSQSLSLQKGAAYNWLSYFHCQQGNQSAKTKVSVLIPSEDTPDKYGYTSNVYSHNTIDKFVLTFYHLRRLGHIRPYCIYLWYSRVPTLVNSVS